MTTGCGGGSKEVGQTSSPPIDLTVIVVDDVSMADEIRKRWELEGDEDSKLTVKDVVASEFLRDQASWTGEVVISPSRDVGELTSRGWIEPISAKDLDNENLAWMDVLPLLRLRECNWGSEVFGVSFGSPVPVLFYRHDLLAQDALEPPKTWREYASLTKHFQSAPDNSSEANSEHWQAAIEPLAGNSGAHLLLARAAGYASHAETLSVLFDTKTMKPRIDSAPFQRAAQQLRDAATATSMEMSSHQALEAILQGRCAMAIGYLESVEGVDDEAWERISVMALPGAEECYDRRSGKWEAQDEGPNSVVLLATRGRIGSIARRTKSRVAAVRLLIRLAGLAWGDEVAPKSPYTTAYRTEHIGNAPLWGPRGVPHSIVEQYLSVQGQQLDGQRNVLVPRLRGGRRLDEALANALVDIIKNEKPVDEALDEAAQRWQAILGEELPESARQEYLKSEGL